MTKDKLKINFIDFLLALFFVAVILAMMSSFFTEEAIQDLKARDYIEITVTLNGVEKDKISLIKEGDVVNTKNNEKLLGNVIEIRTVPESVIIDGGIYKSMDTYKVSIVIRCLGTFENEKTIVSGMTINNGDTIDISVPTFSSAGTVTNIKRTRTTA